MRKRVRGGRIGAGVAQAMLQRGEGGSMSSPKSLLIDVGSVSSPKSVLTDVRWSRCGA